MLSASRVSATNGRDKALSPLIKSEKADLYTNETCFYRDEWDEKDVESKDKIYEFRNRNTNTIGLVFYLLDPLHPCKLFFDLSDLTIAQKHQGQVDVTCPFLFNI